jgi:uncharacterized RDD family membrane protein YckC
VTTPVNPEVIPEHARPYQGRRAGIVTRVAAAVLDGIAVVVIVFALHAVVVGTIFLIHPAGFHWPNSLGWSFLSLVGVIGVIYLTLGWRITGRTWGDAILGVRVVTGGGERLPLATALVRSLFCVFFPIGLFWTAVSRSNRSIQDVVLRTSVIYDWTPQTDRV